jgi:hypothetical protein
MDGLALGAFAFLAGLTACGLAATTMEIVAGVRLSLGEPFVSSTNLCRSAVLVLLAGPYMVANEALVANRRGDIDAMTLVVILAFCCLWLFAAGVLIVGLVSSRDHLIGCGASGLDGPA